MGFAQLDFGGVIPEVFLPSILLEEAQRVLEAAMQKAGEIGQPMNVAVVDNGRNLKAFARMEDAWLGSIDIAMNKVFASTSFLMPTQDLAEMTQPGSHSTASSRPTTVGSSTSPGASR